jgi:glycosyltransferase involved in cell wall biosynthesis
LQHDINGKANRCHYNHPMHILHVTPYYSPAYSFGGVVRAVEGLAQAQVARGLHITVLTTDALTPTQRYRGALESDEGGVRVVRVPNVLYTLRRLNLSTPVGMRRAAARLIQDVEVVHLHELRTLEALLVAPEAARRGIPIVLSPHGTLTTATGRGALKRLWDAMLSPRVLRQLTAVVGLNDDETREAELFIQPTNDRRGAMHCAPTTHPQPFSTSDPPGRPHNTYRRLVFATIPNGIDVEGFAHLDGGAAFRAAWGLGDAPVVLFLGRLHARKGVDVLARAFAQMTGEARLVIAGPDEGMLPTLRALAAADPRIVLTGFLDGEARLGALAAADVFALPATGEGLSMAALEAMATGVPLLLAPGCYLPEAETAGAGVIVAPEVAPLAQALRALLGDAALRERMSAAARALARDRFSWGSVAERWDALYAEVVGGSAEKEIETQIKQG